MKLLRIFREYMENSGEYGMNQEELMKILYKYDLLHWRTPPEPESGVVLIRDEMLLDFLEETWRLEEEQISEMKQDLQGGLLVPKIYQQLQDYSAHFQKVTAVSVVDEFCFRV